RDRELPVEGVLDVLGGQLVAVGEGETFLEGHGEDRVAGELGGLGEVGFGPAVFGADRGAQQVAVALRPHGRGAVVVGGRGVQGGDLVGGADGHGPATAAVTGAAAVLGGLGAGGQQHGHARHGEKHGASSGGEGGIEHGVLLR